MSAIEVKPNTSEDEDFPGSIDVDWISNLPCDVTQCILQYLPLKEAVRTSVLSSQWRYKWTLVSQLEFDEDFFSDLLKFKCCCKEPDYLSGEEWMCEIPQDKFARSEIFDSILGRLVPITMFSLHIPHWFPNDSTISRWIQLVSGKSVKDFSVIQHPDDRKQLPSNMLSSAQFDSLMHLTLQNCSLRSFQNTFRGFPSLVSLHLHVFSTVSLNNNYEILITKCQLLESLSLQNPFLKEVKLCIHAPRLKSLSVFGPFSGIFLEETREIKTLFLGAAWDRWEEWTMEFFTHLSRVEKLVIHWLVWKGSWATEVGPSVKLSPSIEFRELKELILDGVKFQTHAAISFMISLFKMAPKLQKLDINVSHAAESLQHNKIAEGGCHFSHLEQAKLCCKLRSPWLTLQLVKLILSSSPVLKVMVVEVTTDYDDRDDAQLLVERKLNIAKELLLYDRASANAKIIFET